MRGAPRPRRGSREKARPAQSGGPPPPPPRHAGTKTPPHKAASSPNTGSGGARELTPETSGKALSQVWEAGPAQVFEGGMQFQALASRWSTQYGRGSSSRP